MGPRQRRQLEFDAFVDRGFPFSTASDDDSDDGVFGASQTQNNALSTPTDDSQTISTSIGFDSATTETINGNGDTLSLVVVSTVYGISSTDSVTSYTATSSSLPTTTSSPQTSQTMTPTPSPTSDAASAGENTKSPSPTPFPVQQHHHSNDLSTGELAAAIVVPIVAVLALCALLFLCFRRRRQQQSRGEREGSIGAAFIPASIKEKWSSMRTSNASAPRDQPIVTNTQNNAYNTGLDTSSHNSSGETTPGRRSEGFEPPPPPYTLPQMRQNTPLNMSLDMPRSPQGLPPPQQSASPRSPRPNTPSAAALLAMPLDPPQPSSRSARSITSTLYSDTASVHSARAARMSVAGPNVVQSQPNASRSTTGSEELGDPFETEADTPVSPMSSQGR